MPDSSEWEGYRCGYAALAGRPNVGKSTLLNALVGQHLSIVSPLAQTTRERVTGLWSGPEAQIIFLDTPGLLEPRYALQEAMRWTADRAIEDADVVVFLLDATEPDPLPDEPLLRAVEERGVALIVALNKVDRLEESERRSHVQELKARGYETRAVSALTGAGVEELRERLIELLPESPPLFPTEYTATQPLRFFAEEFVRETCMDAFRDEVPYSIACRVEEFREEQDPVYIRITLYVERESQKGIVIGKGGSMIKRVGAASRAKIEQLMGRQVYLDLHVKVLSRWSRKPGQLRHLGFQVPPEGTGTRYEP